MNKISKTYIKPTELNSLSNPDIIMKIRCKIHYTKSHNMM